MKTYEEQEELIDLFRMKTGVQARRIQALEAQIAQGQGQGASQVLLTGHRDMIKTKQQAPKQNQHRTVECEALIDQLRRELEAARAKNAEASTALTNLEATNAALRAQIQAHFNAIANANAREDGELDHASPASYSSHSRSHTQNTHCNTNYNNSNNNNTTDEKLQQQQRQHDQQVRDLEQQIVSLKADLAAIPTPSPSCDHTTFNNTIQSLHSDFDLCRLDRDRYRSNLNHCQSDFDAKLKAHKDKRDNGLQALEDDSISFGSTLILVKDVVLKLAGTLESDKLRYEQQVCGLRDELVIANQEVPRLKGVLSCAEREVAGLKARVKEQNNMILDLKTQLPSGSSIAGGGSGVGGASVRKESIVAPAVHKESIALPLPVTAGVEPSPKGGGKENAIERIPLTRHANKRVIKRLKVESENEKEFILDMDSEGDTFMNVDKENNIGQGSNIENGDEPDEVVEEGDAGNVEILEAMEIDIDNIVVTDAVDVSNEEDNSVVHIVEIDDAVESDTEFEVVQEPNLETVEKDDDDDENRQESEKEEEDLICRVEECPRYGTPDAATQILSTPVNRKNSKRTTPNSGLKLNKIGDDDHESDIRVGTMSSLARENSTSTEAVGVTIKQTTTQGNGAIAMHGDESKKTVDGFVNIEHQAATNKDLQTSEKNVERQRNEKDDKDVDVICRSVGCDLFGNQFKTRTQKLLHDFNFHKKIGSVRFDGKGIVEISRESDNLFHCPCLNFSDANLKAMNEHCKQCTGVEGSTLPVTPLNQKSPTPNARYDSDDDNDVDDNGDDGDDESGVERYSTWSDLVRERIKGYTSQGTDAIAKQAHQFRKLHDLTKFHGRVFCVPRHMYQAFMTFMEPLLNKIRKADSDSDESESNQKKSSSRKRKKTKKLDSPASDASSRRTRQRTNSQTPTLPSVDLPWPEIIRNHFDPMYRSTGGNDAISNRALAFRNQNKLQTVNGGVFYIPKPMETKFLEFLTPVFNGLSPSKPPVIPVQSQTLVPNPTKTPVSSHTAGIKNSLTKTPSSLGRLLDTGSISTSSLVGVLNRNPGGSTTSVTATLVTPTTTTKHVKPKNTENKNGNSDYVPSDNDDDDNIGEAVERIPNTNVDHANQKPNHISIQDDDENDTSDEEVNWTDLVRAKLIHFTTRKGNGKIIRRAKQFRKAHRLENGGPGKAFRVPKALRTAFLDFMDPVVLERLGLAGVGANALIVESDGDDGVREGRKVRRESEEFSTDEEEGSTGDDEFPTYICDAVGCTHEKEFPSESSLNRHKRETHVETEQVKFLDSNDAIELQFLQNNKEPCRMLGFTPETGQQANFVAEDGYLAMQGTRFDVGQEQQQQQEPKDGYLAMLNNVASDMMKGTTAAFQEEISDSTLAVSQDSNPFDLTTTRDDAFCLEKEEDDDEDDDERFHMLLNDLEQQQHNRAINTMLVPPPQLLPMEATVVSVAGSSTLHVKPDVEVSGMEVDSFETIQQGAPVASNQSILSTETEDKPLALSVFLECAKQAAETVDTTTIENNRCLRNEDQAGEGAKGESASPSTSVISSSSITPSCIEQHVGNVNGGFGSVVDEKFDGMVLDAVDESLEKDKMEVANVIATKEGVYDKEGVDPLMQLKENMEEKETENEDEIRFSETKDTVGIIDMEASRSLDVADGEAVV
ncbi:UNVERIFIED_CONTAM: hypothetical protein HDU68_009953 [Siphonaria sp. JEL0065]|nr:hypothetical protein HDU68_009953 [Siphonaria sp. JEL0065]